VNPRELRISTEAMSHHSSARVGVCARVSTSNGHQDPEMQLAELREYAGRRGWQITEEYVTTGSRDRRSRGPH